MKEQIYADFTNKVLPQIGEGLQITKEYFGDLFGRYVKYLLVMDILSLAFTVAILTSGIVLTFYAVKHFAEWDRTDNVLTMFGPTAAGVLVLIGGVGTMVNTMELVKTIFVPEVRVMEQIGQAINQR